MENPVEVRCPVCGSKAATHYESHFECSRCGRQWTQVGSKKKRGE